MNQIHHIAIYDISKDSLRNRVANKLLDYGMQRIQFSAFMGILSLSQREQLTRELKEICNNANDNDSVFIVPICEVCLGKSTILGSIDLQSLELPPVIMV